MVAQEVAVDVAGPVVVSRAVVGVAAAGEAASAGQEAAVVSAVAVVVRRGVAGVVSPGAAAVSVVVASPGAAAAAVAAAGSKRLQPITESPVSIGDWGASFVSLPGTVFRRASISLSIERSHNVRSGMSWGTWTGYIGVFGRAWVFCRCILW